MSVGNSIYNPRKYKKQQFINTTNLQAVISSECFIQRWSMKWNDKKTSGKISNFIRATKTNSSTGNAGAYCSPSVIVSCTFEQAKLNLDLVFLLVLNEQISTLLVTLLSNKVNFQLQLVTHQLVWEDLEFN